LLDFLCKGVRDLLESNENVRLQQNGWAGGAWSRTHDHTIVVITIIVKRKSFEPSEPAETVRIALLASDRPTSGSRNRWLCPLVKSGKCLRADKA
jgi:hypothetical protein